MKPTEALSLKAGIVSNLSAAGGGGQNNVGKSLQPSGLCGVPFSRLQQQADQEIEKVQFFSIAISAYNSYEVMVSFNRYVRSII